jgi:hypothetical protein
MLKCNKCNTKIFQVWEIGEISKVYTIDQNDKPLTRSKFQQKDQRRMIVCPNCSLVIKQTPDLHIDLS